MTTSPASDPTLVRYLLGELPEEEQSALERSYFADEDVFERLVALDSDLMDEYVHGEMDPETRRKFELRLRSAPGRERVAFARSLQDAFAAVKPGSPDKPGPMARASGHPIRRSRSFLPMPIAAALLLVASAAWLAMESRSLRQERQSLAAARAELESRVRRLGEQIEEQRLAVEQLARQSPPGASEAGMGVRPSVPPDVRAVSFVLTAGLLRDPSNLNRLAVPKNTSVVRLDLVLETGAYQSYAAVLERASGAELWRRDGLRSATPKASPETLSVSLPAALLAPGDYVLNLFGKTPDGKRESVAEYVFGITRG